jgi:acyl dehydratase
VLREGADLGGKEATMPVNLSVIGKQLDSSVHEYSEKDVILYALGVGCGPEDLEFVYEQDLKVLPTFAVIPAFPALFAMGSAMDVNPLMVLHGEQRIELHGAIPTSGRLTTTPTVTAIYDKGKGALVVTETETADAKGTLLFRNVFGAFARGEGGFGGDRGPSGPRNAPPERKPDAVVEMKTLPQQALLYRLSGDMNPLHADPNFAKIGGFDKPILHGLCTFGYVGRALLKSFCGNEPSRLKDFEARFAGVVYPGETIVTEMWDAKGGKILVQARTKERGEPVINSAAATVG